MNRLSHVLLFIALFLNVSVGGASVNFPEIKGKIWFNNASENPAQFSISLTFACTFPEGPLFKVISQPCGQVTQSAALNADGTFAFTPFKLDDSHHHTWEGSEYVISKNGIVLLTGSSLPSSPNKLAPFLKNLTILEIGPTPAHLSTSTGISYANWMQNLNYNKPAELLIEPSYVGSANKNNGALAIAQANNQFSQANSVLSGNYLVSGTIADVKQNYRWKATLTAPGFDPYSPTFALANAPIDEAISYPASLVNLVIQITEATGFAGKWSFFVQVDEPDVSIYSAEDPGIVTNTICQNGKLSGTVTYIYSHADPINNQLTHTSPITGTCGDSFADFDVTYQIVETVNDDGKKLVAPYPQHQDNFHFHVMQTDSNDAKVDITPSSGGVKLGYATATQIWPADAP